MGHVWQDIRFTFRNLRRNPFFAAVAILSLGIGIGANVTIFTAVDAVFKNPLPVRDASHLIRVFTFMDLNDRLAATLFGVSYSNFQDLASSNGEVASLTGFVPAPVTLSGPIEAESISASLVPGNYFDLLGVGAERGVTFSPEVDQPPGAHSVAVISHSLWMRAFGGDPSILGRKVEINAHPYTIVGVTPGGFKGVSTFNSADRIWLPLSMHDQILTGVQKTYFDKRGALLVNVIGRLKKGVSGGQAEAALQTSFAHLREEYPTANKDRDIRVRSLVQAATGINQRNQYVKIGVVLMAVVGIVLLIACANVANLLLARAAGRETEMGIRTALGAGQGRILAQLLTESLCLALLGGAAGSVLALWGRRLLWSFRPPGFPADALSLSFGSSVVLFTAGVTLATGIFFGLVPALRSSRPDVNEALKVGGRQSSRGGHRNRFRGVLVISEVALAVLALISAGLFIRSLTEARKIDLGFRADNLIDVPIDLAASGYAADRGRQFYRKIVGDLKGLPGVQQVAISAISPMSGSILRLVYPKEKGQKEQTTAAVNSVSPGYLKTLGITLLQGRDIGPFDRQETLPVALINQAAARRLWPNQSPLGKHLRIVSEPVDRQVVGVVRNTILFGIGESPQPIAYLPMEQYYTGTVSIEVRTHGNPHALIGAVKQKLREADRRLALTGVRTMKEIVAGTLWGPRMGAWLLGIFGLIALTLAVIGIYGVMAYNVSQRRWEIGLRLALGARPLDVLRLILRQGMVWASLGIASGLTLALLLSRAAGSLLFGITSTDPETYIFISLLLLLVAVLSCLMPASRAARVDPKISLG